MSAVVVLQQMTVIAVLVCIGVYLEKKGVLGEKVTGSISRLIVELCNPALTVSAVSWVIPFLIWMEFPVPAAITAVWNVTVLQPL